MNKATVIIPTTGTSQLRDAIDSVLAQTIPTTCYVVCDGPEFEGKVSTIISDYKGDSRVKICYLPINVGANGFYGHRVYASFTHLVDTEYVMYLDQDCWLNTNHIESCIETIETNNLDWCYSLRKIYDKYNNFICRDDCESLGKWMAWTNTHHIDTNCYFIKTEIAVKLASVWHGGWGQDRVFLSVINQHFPNYGCTGDYTVCYRVDGNAGSVTSDFFIEGNNKMNTLYKGEFPWKKI